MSDDLPVFTQLKVFGWRQFQTVTIDFHPRLTVLTGANGSGKSTLLNILTQHYGWERPYLGTPILTSEGAAKYFSGVYRVIKSWLGIEDKTTYPDQDIIGHLVKSDLSS